MYVCLCALCMWHICNFETLGKPFLTRCSYAEYSLTCTVRVNRQKKWNNAAVAYVDCCFLLYINFCEIFLFLNWLHLTLCFIRWNEKLGSIYFVSLFVCSRLYSGCICVVTVYYKNWGVLLYAILLIVKIDILALVRQTYNKREWERLGERAQ